MNNIHFFLFFVLIVLAGCSKTNSSTFSWNYLGMHYVADSSSVSIDTVSGQPDARIVASSSTVGLTALGIDGGSKLAVGSYAFHTYNSNHQPYMFYIYVGELFSQSGVLNITYNNNTVMSGNFSVTYTDSSVMTGAFTDIPIR